MIVTNAGELWMGDVASFQVVDKVLGLSSDPSVVSQVRESMRASDDELENPVGYSTAGNLALISVSGPTVSATSFMTRFFGIASYQDLVERLNEAAADRAVKGVVINYDTNGGSASGVSDTADFIRQFSNEVKPIIGFTSSKALSAGYWLLSSSAKAVAGKNAALGSIGVIAVHFEVTRQLDAMGVTPRVFRSAQFKALGHPAEKLSVDGADAIQKSIDRLHEAFVTGVSDMRGIPAKKVAEQIANGKEYSSQEALGFKMIDNVLTFEQTIARFSKSLGRA